MAKFDGNSKASACDSDPGATPRWCCKACLQWGRESFQRLRGMFAFAIWTEVERRLVLCPGPAGNQAALHPSARRRSVLRLGAEDAVRP